MRDDVPTFSYEHGKARLALARCIRRIAPPGTPPMYIWDVVDAMEELVEHMKWDAKQGAVPSPGEREQEL